jgi:hypothetical protein
MVSGSFRAPYQEFLEIPVMWFGVLFGVGRLLASLVLMYSGQIKSRIKDITEFYRYQLIIFGILFFILGLVGNATVVAIVFIVMNAFKWGLTRVGEAFTLEIIKTSRFRATLLSVQAQIEEAIIAVSSLGLGFAIDRWNYQFAFLITAFVFVIVLIPFYIYIKKRHRVSNSFTA